MFNSKKKPKQQPAATPGRPMNISTPTGAKHIGHLGNDGKVSQSASEDWKRINDALNSRLKTMGANGLSQAEANFVQLQLEKVVKGENGGNPAAQQQSVQKPSGSTQSQNTSNPINRQNNTGSPATANKNPSAQPSSQQNKQITTTAQTGGFTKENYEYYRSRCKKLEQLVPRTRDLNSRVKALEAKLLQQHKEFQAAQKAKVDLEKTVRAMRSNGGSTGGNQNIAALQDELDDERDKRITLESKVAALEVELEVLLEEKVSLQSQIEEQSGLLKRLENGFNMAMDQIDMLQQSGGGASSSGLPDYNTDPYSDPYGDSGDSSFVPGESSLLSGISPELLANIDPDMGDEEMLQFLTQALINRRQSQLLDTDKIEDMLANLDLEDY